VNIKKFSEQTGISAHTLRYYEKIGLIRGVRRNASGHREYSDADLRWVDFIKRLKSMGMALENIQKYADLREQGEETSKERMEILQNHVEVLEKRIFEEQENMKRLINKIEVYQAYLDDQKGS